MDDFIVNVLTVLLFAFIGYKIYKKLQPKFRRSKKRIQKKLSAIGVIQEAAPAFQAHDVPMAVDGYVIAYKYDNVKLYILSGQEPDYSDLIIGEDVRLIQEPQNVYDNRAVYAETVKSKIKIGYLYKNKLQDMTNEYIDQNIPIVAFIDGINKAKDEISLFMAFYRK